MLSKFVISSVGRRGGVKVGKALFSSDAVATTGVIDKVMQDFDGKDSNIKINAAGKGTLYETWSRRRCIYIYITTSTRTYTVMSKTTIHL